MNIRQLVELSPTSLFGINKSGLENEIYYAVILIGVIIWLIMGAKVRIIVEFAKHTIPTFASLWT